MFQLGKLNFKSISKNFPIFNSFKILFQVGHSSVTELWKKFSKQQKGNEGYLEKMAAHHSTIPLFVFLL